MRYFSLIQPIFATVSTNFAALRRITALEEGNRIATLLPVGDKMVLIERIANSAKHLKLRIIMHEYNVFAQQYEPTEDHWEFSIKDN